MRAEIISIGTELLVGSILNTNSRFLSQKLAQNAVDIYHQTTVGDNIERIVDALKAAAARSDVIISSGGLGPTEDDVTVRAISHFLQRPLVFHKPTYRHIMKRLKKRGLGMTRLVAIQCNVPREAVIFRNQMGTAPGTLSSFLYNGQPRWLLVLPGPPRELEPMFDKAFPTLSRLAKIRKEYFHIRSIKIAGLLESQVAQKVTDLLKLRPPLTIGIYARPNEVELKIMAKSHSLKAANAMAAGVEKKIRQRLGSHVFGVDNETLASVVGKLLKDKKHTLAIAESCTGGLLSHQVTETPGSSDYFLGSIVAYSNQIKINELNIKKSLIMKNGAVSAPVAAQMAKNVREIFSSTQGIAITGIAGPSGGSARKPVGLVFIAIADSKGSIVRKFTFLGNRSDIKRSAANKALDFLRLKLQHKL